MDTPLFRNIIEEVAPLTNVVALHLMGDPLLHPKLEEFVEICNEHDLEVFFVTNGVLLGSKEMEILLHPAFRQVSFSLHSFPDNFPDKNPSSYLKAIFRYTEMALERRPSLFINYRLWNLSHPQGSSEKNEEILRQIEEYFQIRVVRHRNTRLKPDYKIRGRLSLHFDVEFKWPALNLPVLGVQGTCLGLKSHFGVLVDGTVVPCCLDKEGDIPLGKIPETPLREILGSSRAQALVRGFRQGNLVESLCQRCQYIERFQPAKEALPLR